jgi:hypothetical protein
VRRRFALPSSAVPKRWTRSVQTALVHVMSPAHYALVHTRSWAANGRNQSLILSAGAPRVTTTYRNARSDSSETTTAGKENQALHRSPGCAQVS